MATRPITFRLLLECWGIALLAGTLAAGVAMAGIGLVFELTGTGVRGSATGAIVIAMIFAVVFGALPALLGVAFFGMLAQQTGRVSVGLATLAGGGGLFLGALLLGLGSFGSVQDLAVGAAGLALPGAAGGWAAATYARRRFNERTER